jgi:succinate dehydrogenase / fumarate reductase iron-sulfur subunit
MERVTLRIRRYNPDDDNGAYWQEYSVDIEPGDVVLQALMRVREDLDGTLAFRASCRSGICGSDGMVINGWPRLACKTQVSDVASKSGMIQLEPLYNLACLKDLVVDQEPFWTQFSRITPWLMPDPAVPEPEKERLMVLEPDAFDLLSKASDCIFCQICFAACPIVGLDREFLGPQALVKAYRFEADPRDQGHQTREAVLGAPEGVWRCRTTFNCTEACPKGIPITRTIQLLKRALVREAIFS